MVRECARFQMFPGCPIWRNGGRAFKRAGKVGEFPKPYARIEYGMIRAKQKGGKAAFLYFFWGLR